MKTKHLLIPALAGLMLLGACKSKNYEYDKSSVISADTAKDMADTNATAATQKLIKTGDIRFKVKNVEKTGEKISALTAGYGGMVMHHEMNAAASQTNDIRVSDDSVMRVAAFVTAADMTVKIPSEKIEPFLDSVSHLGVLVNVRRMDIEDKSLDYLATRLKVNNRQELSAEQKKGKVVIKDPNAVLALRDDVVDGVIDNRKIDDAVKYSTITLSFYQNNSISKEMVANDDAESYHLPFYKQVSMAVAGGLYIFEEVFVGLMYTWAFLICGVVGFLVFRAYQKRKVKLT